MYCIEGRYILLWMGNDEYKRVGIVGYRACIVAWAKKKKNLDLGFALHRAVLYRYQDPPKKISIL